MDVDNVSNIEGSDCNIILLLHEAGSGIFLIFLASLNGDKSLGPAIHFYEVFDDLLSSIIVVFDNFAFKVMSPSNALNAINQDNMSVLKNEAVNVARLV
jgi:hypothetical protein